MWWVNYYLWREKGLISHIDKFIVAEDKYSEYFNKVTKKELIPLLNCKRLISKKYIPPNNDKLKLFYIGTLNFARYIHEIIDVVKDIEDVECTIGGNGSEEYVNEIIKKCKETNNVKFIGRVTPEKVIPMTLESDVVLCMINPKIYNNQIATANKQFEAMVCGRPIICTKGTRSGEITEKENCGIVVEFDKEALKKGIIKLRDDQKLCKELGKNGLKAAIKEYNWEKQEKKLIEVYEKMNDKRPSRK